MPGKLGPSDEGEEPELMAGDENVSHGDPEENEPTPTVEIPTASTNEDATQVDTQKKVAFADVVRTLMIVKNWVLSAQQMDDGRDAHLEGGGMGDEFMDKYTISSVTSSVADLETLDQIQEDILPTHKRFLRRLINRLKKPVNPAKKYYYRWTTVVTVACIYNLMILVARASFDQLQLRFSTLWIVLDYLCDLIYLMDIVIQAKKGYLEQGLMVRELSALINHYIASWQFKVDLISILPTDMFYIIWPYQPLVRINRLLHCYRISDFSDRTETQTSFPNGFRVLKLMSTIFVIFHWNACLYFTLSKTFGIGPNSDKWVFSYKKILNPVLPTCSVWDTNCPLYIRASDIAAEEDDVMGILGGYGAMNGSLGGVELWNQTQSLSFAKYANFTEYVPFTNLTRQYVFSFYWSALILTTIGEQVPPQTNVEYAFVIVDILLGLLIFATIIGNVASMISSMNAAKAEFQERLDGVKQYMEYRKVTPDLQKCVLKWFNYIWSQKQSLDEEAVTENLPTKLKAELAIQVHLETLKRVRIFQDCDPGLLVELVLKLKLQVFSPNDYICRKGDIGKEMYIVKRGSLNVVSEDGKVVFVTLKEGSVFGELSILNIPGNKNGNRRTAGVRSVGYSDLFVLSKDDLWEALKEYPEAKKLLLAKGNIHEPQLGQ